MSKTKGTQFNYGISLLKVFMSFVVVLCHCWQNTTTLLPIKTLLSMAVPTFMFVSFFLTQKGFTRKDNIYI